MVDIEDLLVRGGAGRIALLRYCVMSIRMEAVFIFLAQEYRYRPSHAGALALFDLFCGEHAPARLKAYELLPPRQLGLSAAVTRVREQWHQMQSPPPQDENDLIAVMTPARDLFDTIVRGLRGDVRFTALGASYDPQLTPQENLPGGKMTAGQRQFVEGVWNPVVKPRLTAAGFWQMRTIG
jgi:hypothetical protein